MATDHIVYDSEQNISEQSTYLISVTFFISALYHTLLTQLFLEQLQSLIRLTKLMQKCFFSHFRCAISTFIWTITTFSVQNTECFYLLYEIWSLLQGNEWQLTGFIFDVVKTSGVSCSFVWSQKNRKSDCSTSIHTAV